MYETTKLTTRRRKGNYRSPRGKEETTIDTLATFLALILNRAANLLMRLIFYSSNFKFTDDLFLILPTTVFFKKIICFLRHLFFFLQARGHQALQKSPIIATPLLNLSSMISSFNYISEDPLPQVQALHSEKSLFIVKPCQDVLELHKLLYKKEL